MKKVLATIMGVCLIFLNTCKEKLEPEIPTISTASVTSISTISAISGGTIITDNGSAIISRGVCWSINQNPTTSDNKTNDGTDVGTFTSNITNLQSGQTYYVRAYATNGVGVAYGNAVTFTTKENRDFDPTKSSEVTVEINTSEIGGNNLMLVSSRDDDSPLSSSLSKGKGLFKTIASKEGAQLFYIKDIDLKVRALTMSIPKNTGIDILEINPTSVAITAIFLTPGILNTDALEADKTVQKIRNLSAFQDFVTFLAYNLGTKSLDQLSFENTYNSLLKACINEYLQKIEETGNYFTINQLSGGKVELRNSAFRFVAVGERDISSTNTELNCKTLVTSMSGGVPLSWGSLFQGSTWSPTIETIDYIPTLNTSSSEFWVVGLGFKSPTDTPPSSIKNIETPVIETILMYLVFPAIDFFGGTTSLLKECKNLKESTSLNNFNLLLDKAKKDVSVIKLMAANNDEALTRELINVTILVGSKIATQVALQYGIPGVGQFFALASAFIAAANLGPTIATLITTEQYCKFIIYPNNRPPLIPTLISPANGATGVSTSTTLSWSCSDPDGDALTYDVYFGTASNPTSTISTNQTSISISRTGLSNNTTYYWEIVAKDINGTQTFGPIWSFMTIASTTNPSGELVDSRDGQVYKTIKIGSQWWMAENLNFNTGNSWCYKLLSNNCEKYGMLYLTNENACPSGWHLPSVEDWYTLCTTMGITKVDDSIYFDAHHFTFKDANELFNGGNSGMDLLKGGYCMNLNGMTPDVSFFNYLETIGIFHTSTNEIISGSSCQLSIWIQNLCLDGICPHLIMTFDNPSNVYGGSIRCIKN